MADGDAVSVESPEPVAAAVETATTARAAFDQAIDRAVRGMVDDRVEAVVDDAAATVGQAQTTAQEVAFDAVAGHVPVETSQAAGGTTVTVTVDEAE